jgi:hypothetical protein
MSILTNQRVGALLGMTAALMPAQGTTVDQVYALPDPLMNRNAAYVPDGGADRRGGLGANRRQAADEELSLSVLCRSRLEARRLQQDLVEEPRVFAGDGQEKGGKPKVVSSWQRASPTVPTTIT